jgi:AraC family transcriptional regulator, transcriptional activator of pobA
MFNFQENTIIGEYRQALKGRSNEKVIDLDEKLGKKLECFIIPLENLLRAKGRETPPFRQSRFTIFFVKKGKGKKIIGSVPVFVKNCTLMVVPSRVVSTSLYSGNIIKGYCLSFNLECFLKLPFPLEQILRMNLFNPALLPYCYVNSEEAKMLENVFEPILYEVKHNRENRDLMIAGKLIELFILCDRIFKTGKPLPANFHSPLIVRFISLIHELHKQHHTAGDYARKLNVHPNSLNATAKLYLGQSAKATIESKLLSESQYLLQQTSLSVQEISYELGFNSATHFFRFFKKHMNHSPLKYRQKYLNR